MTWTLKYKLSIVNSTDLLQNVWMTQKPCPRAVKHVTKIISAVDHIWNGLKTEWIYFDQGYGLDKLHI